MSEDLPKAAKSLEQRIAEQLMNGERVTHVMVAREIKHPGGDVSYETMGVPCDEFAAMLRRVPEGFVYGHRLPIPGAGLAGIVEVCITWKPDEANARMRDGWTLLAIGTDNLGMVLGRKRA
jgi:hypothetical protein